MSWIAAVMQWLILSMAQDTCRRQMTRSTAFEEDEELSDEALARRARREAHWRSMFNISLGSDRARKYGTELLLEAADRLAAEYLHQKVSLPPHPHNATTAWTDIDRGCRLPAVTCAFNGCTWYAGATVISAWKIRQHQEHPWDRELRELVLEAHRDRLVFRVYFKIQSTPENIQT